MARKHFPAIFQLYITLMDSDPLIWRRVVVTSDISLSDFHVILQAAMGWEGGQLHRFIHQNKYYRDLEERSSDLDDDKTFEESSVILESLLPRVRNHLMYEYDFRDHWLHKVVLEKKLPYSPDLQLPSCLEGARCCPPEDCGGMWRYERMLEGIANPQDPEYEQLKEWMGENFDPEFFDKEQVNAILRRPEILQNPFV